MHPAIGRAGRRHGGTEGRRDGGTEGRACWHTDSSVVSPFLCPFHRTQAWHIGRALWHEGRLGHTQPSLTYMQQKPLHVQSLSSAVRKRGSCRTPLWFTAASHSPIRPTTLMTLTSLPLTVRVGVCACACACAPVYVRRLNASCVPPGMVYAACSVRLELAAQGVRRRRHALIGPGRPHRARCVYPRQNRVVLLSEARVLFHPSAAYAHWRGMGGLSARGMRGLSSQARVGDHRAVLRAAVAALRFTHTQGPRPDWSRPSASAAVELSATAVPIAANGSVHSAPL